MKIMRYVIQQKITNHVISATYHVHKTNGNSMFCSANKKGGEL
jgi:hypothetical protein